MCVCVRLCAYLSKAVTVTSAVSHCVQSGWINDVAAAAHVTIFIPFQFGVGQFFMEAINIFALAIAHREIEPN